MSVRLAVTVIAALAALVALVSTVQAPEPTVLDQLPLVATVYPAADPAGVIVTSGGWAYCEQMRPVARRTHYTLLCGRYAKDGYTGLGLRSERHLDWGNRVLFAAVGRRRSATPPQGRRRARADRRADTQASASPRSRRTIPSSSPTGWS